MNHLFLFSFQFEDWYTKRLNHNQLDIFVLKIEGINKNYHGSPALKNVTLKVPENGILGILGPNGAGKTTLFKIIAGLLVADRGEVVPSSEKWPRIGYKPERLHFPDRMSVRQYMKLMANMSGIPAGEQEKTIQELLAFVGMQAQAGKRLGQCSKGMRQRIGLAQALLGDPQLLVLDEPTDGLDPVGQGEILNAIRELVQWGKTIVLSSHRLDEVTSVCHEIAILNRGEVIYQNYLDSAVLDRPRAIIFVDRPLDPIKSLLESFHQEVVVRERSVVLKAGAAELRRKILSILLSAGFDILQIERRQSSLNEIYKEVTRQ
ncbi:MAG: ABC transporter ATP-binding protein [Ardenticatenaceae bacterium]|nr:ABC transporter ATP-binding protein [Ardenticatenaceae bacterium]